MSLGRRLLHHHQLQGHFPSMHCFKFFALILIHASFDSQFPHLNPVKLCKLDNATVLQLPSTFSKIIIHPYVSSKIVEPSLGYETGVLCCSKSLCGKDPAHCDFWKNCVLTHDVVSITKKVLHSPYPVSIRL